MWTDLWGAVDGEHGRGDEGGGGGDVDDDAALALDHLRQHEFGHVRDRADVAVDEVGESFVGHLEEVLGIGVAHAHVVDQHAHLQPHQTLLHLLVDQRSLREVHVDHLRRHFELVFCK